MRNVLRTTGLKTKREADGADSGRAWRAGNRDSSSTELPDAAQSRRDCPQDDYTVIPARCIESGCDLPHDDRDFDPFVKHLGLRVVI
jgi:hypothetical protein